MDYFQAISLGILQGITEFLPISSSGHLVIAQKMFGMENPPIFFDILVHFGTLLAVFFYFRKKLWKVCLGIAKREEESINFLKLLILGTLPIGITGFLLRDSIDIIFNSLKLVGFAYLGMAAILFATGIANKKNASGAANQVTSTSTTITTFTALFIGLFQALAILPGISRSGSTIAAGIFRKINRETAFEFSFILAIPAILGALILEFFDLKTPEIQNLGVNLVGMFAAAIFGFLSLGVLKRILISRKFHLFGFYCLALGLLVLFYLVV